MTAADDGLGPLAALVSPPLRGANAYHVPTPAGSDAKLDANELGIALPPELAAGLAGGRQYWHGFPRTVVQRSLLSR